MSLGRPGDRVRSERHRPNECVIGAPYGHGVRFVAQVLTIGLPTVQCCCVRPHSGNPLANTIVEHVCLELTDRAEIPVNRGKTVRTTSDAVYDIAVEYKSEAGMRRLLGTAVEYVQSLVDGQPYRLDERIAEVLEIATHGELGP